MVLAILDGWGHRDDSYGNAIAAAHLPNWRAMLAANPWTVVAASGEEVGLPAGVMGNSEVGHINIGSGRVVPQGVVVINEAIADGSFGKNPVLHACVARLKTTGGRLHLMGLLSDGSVHSSIDHLLMLIEVAAAAKLPIAIHVFGDGRDVPPRSIEPYLELLEKRLSESAQAGAIATVSGRFFAMDRDRRWDRVQRAYDAIANAHSDFAYATAKAAVHAAYGRGEGDEFMQPAVVGQPRPVRDGDAAIFFNFRPDRARELTMAFSRPAFNEFAVNRYADLEFATMTRYEEDFPNPVLFGPRPQSATFGEIVADAGMTQLRLAETEKYAHVTYFFNGGREDVFSGEDRILVPSDRSVATYDLAPAMRAVEITDAAVEDIRERRHDLIVMNYANADMVGHTGNLEATIKSVQTLDRELGRLKTAVGDASGLLAITADHGNAEAKLDGAGNPLTAHTTNPVPFVLIGSRPLGRLRSGGRLGDIAPTLLPLLALEVPSEMTGQSLLP